MKNIIFAKKIFTENGITENGAVLTQNGIIAKIYDSRADLKPDYDFSDLNLYPGLVDIHIHGGYGLDVMNGEKDILNLAEKKLKEGITAFCPTLITSSPDKMKAVLKDIEKIKSGKTDKLKLSRILGCFLEGPYISKKFCGIHNKSYIKDLDYDEIKALLDSFSSVISRIAIAPEYENSPKIIELLKEYNVKAAIGHSGADSLHTEAAIAAGADTAIHTFNAMKAFEHRNSGILGAVLTDERIFCEIIADLVHTDLTALKLILRCKGKNKIIIVSDCISAGGLSDGEYLFSDKIIYVKGSQARSIDSTIAGSVLKLTDGIKNMIKAGADICDAVNMASINPAAAIGADNIIGSIKENKAADFFIGDDDLNVKYVFKNGMMI